jgi:hypothetical protein
MISDDLIAVNRDFFPIFFRKCCTHIAAGSLGTAKKSAVNCTVISSPQFSHHEIRAACDAAVSSSL